LQWPAGLAGVITQAAAMPVWPVNRKMVMVMLRIL